jgi:hypothetical protein
MTRGEVQLKTLLRDLAERMRDDRQEVAEAGTSSVEHGRGGMRDG